MSLRAPRVGSAQPRAAATRGLTVAPRSQDTMGRPVCVVRLAHLPSGSTVRAAAFKWVLSKLEPIVRTESPAHAHLGAREVAYPVCKWAPRG